MLETRSIINVPVENVRMKSRYLWHSMDGLKPCGPIVGVAQARVFAGFAGSVAFPTSSPQLSIHLPSDGAYASIYKV